MATKKVVPLIIERSTPGRRGYRLPELDVPEIPLSQLIPEEHLRTEPAELPEVSELEVVRHYTQLSRLNHGVDVGFYPLGSCTMKYNPRVHEDVTSLPGFAALHPYQPESSVQGAMELMFNLSEYLAVISGLEATTLQPAAGAHGELAGLMVIKAFHAHNGESHRNEMLIPDSAHGTNPASSAMVGYKVIEVPSDDRGGVDVEALKKLVGPNTAGLMLTNPNTLGLFDENICTISQIVHDAGGLLYYDGANANAILGIVRPGDMGFDVVHYNLHKTFSTPHGGGGPGMGPIGVAEHLVPFLPNHEIIEISGEEGISAVSAAPFGSASILVISHAYIAMMGAEGLTNATKTAILNANYIKARLEQHYPVLYAGANGRCAHEMILDCRGFKNAGIEVADIAKRLMDYGFHAPTVSFPVAGTLMVEPTESESKAELDRFCDALIAIRSEIAAVESGDADQKDNVLKNAPHTARVVTADEWDRPYSRQTAAYPIEYLRINKFWPSVGRVNDSQGDRTLICSCPPMEAYAEI